jgi:hypothetical protein
MGLPTPGLFRSPHPELQGIAFQFASAALLLLNLASADIFEWRDEVIKNKEKY